MSIPIRNLYYLLCYAWDRLDEGQLLDVTQDDYQHIVDLFARVLAGGMEHVLKRGLDRGYREQTEAIVGVRGKLDFSASLKSHSFVVGRAVCAFDELTHDVPHNRILKATIGRLLKAEDLDRRIQPELVHCYRRLDSVADVRLSVALFNSVQLHSNNGFYLFLLRVCRLIFDTSVVDEQRGTVRFRDFVRDDGMMARLFEKFILNFLKREQQEFRIWSEQIQWADVVADPTHLTMLPSMRTDISAQSLSRRIVIDAKYYRETFQSHFGRDSVRSGHLYQLMAYLGNLQRQGAGERIVEGVLLYPAIDATITLDYTIHAHPIRIRSIDLSAEWREIHHQLLHLLTEPSAHR